MHQHKFLIAIVSPSFQVHHLASGNSIIGVLGHITVTAFKWWWWLDMVGHGALTQMGWVRIGTIMSLDRAGTLDIGWSSKDN